MTPFLINIYYFILIVFLSFLFNYFLLIIHEIGHLIIALLNGHRFLSINTGFFRVYRSKKGLKFSIIKKVDGFCQTVPPKDILTNHNKLNKITKKILLAGPITNTIFFIFILITIIIIFKNQKSFSIYLSSLIMPLFFCISSFKKEYDGGWSDMYAYSLLNDPSKKYLMESVLRIQYSFFDVKTVEDLENNEGFKNVNFDDLEILLKSNNTDFKYFALNFAFYYYRKIGNLIKAKEMKEEQLLLDEQVSNAVKQKLKINN